MNKSQIILAPIFLGGGRSYSFHLIEEAKKSLEQKGVEFIGEIETVPDIVKLATFVDPDGHSLMLSEN